MPHNPYQSFNQPFQSGCSLCKPSTDYKKYWGGNRGRYSKDGLIPNTASSPFDLKNNGYNSMKLENELTGEGINLAKKNYGITYQTTGGVKKKTKRKTTKRKTTKRKTTKRKSTKRKTTKRKTIKRSNSITRKLSRNVMNKIKKLGKVLGAVEKLSVNTTKKVLKTGRNTTVKGYKIGRNTTKKVLKTGRNTTVEGYKMGRNILSELLIDAPKNTMKEIKTMKSKVVRKRSKKHRGGDTNWGATGMPMQYYDPKYVAKEPNKNVYNSETPYGKYQPRGCPGESCNLMPFNPYDNPPSSVFKTGGRKKNNRRTKSNKKSKQRGGLCLQQGKDLLSSANGYPYSPRWGSQYCKKGGSMPKKKTTLKRK